MPKRLSSGVLRLSTLAITASLACACTTDDNIAAEGSAGAAGTVGAGGSAGSSSAQTNCPTPGPIEPGALVDDWEDGNALLPSLAGRTGTWWLTGDGTEGTIFPDGEVPPEEILGGRCGSTRGIHVTGQGFTDWGSALSVNWKWGSKPDGTEGMLPYDGSAYTGVRFWAKLGDTSTATVRLQFTDKTSHIEGGICVEDGGVGKGCWDSWGIDLPQLSTQWQEYRIRFNTLAQRDFGIKEEKLDTTALYDVSFSFPAGVVFDFWLDDFWFTTD